MSDYAGELDYRAFGQHLHQVALDRRIPLVGSLATTYRCNLKCRHCYLQGCRDLEEISCREWLGIIDQIAEAGCLWLVITGGEPLLRDDFKTVYRHAQSRGLLVGVFTNGTLIDDSVIDLWRECPPWVVEISLYGATAGTCGQVTGVPESCRASLEAARRLAAEAIPLRLKTMALRQNLHEIDRLRQFSEELRAEFRFDSMVSAGLMGSKRPCATRLSQDCIMDLDRGDQKQQRGWDQFLDRHKALPPRESLFTCSAGLKYFSIGPDGRLALCPFDTPVYDTRRGSFLEGWNGPVKERRENALPPDHPCRGCQDGVFCGVCPPVARMETGSDLGWSRSLCELGKRKSNEVLARQQSRRAGAVGVSSGV